MEMIQPLKPATPISTQPPPTASNGSEPKLTAIPGQISEQEALKGGDQAKLNDVSLGRIGDAAQAGNAVSLGSLVEAKLVIEVTDTLVPTMLVLVFHAAKIQLNKSVFQLSAKEKDTLAPILQKCLESVNINFNSPWVALGVTAGAFYFAKSIEAIGKAKIDQRTEEQKRKSAVKSAEESATAEKVRKKKEAEKNAPVVNAEVVTAVLREWDEDDVKKVIDKRRKGRPDAVNWLNNNWVKKGGVI